MLPTITARYCTGAAPQHRYSLGHHPFSQESPGTRGGSESALLRTLHICLAAFLGFDTHMLGSTTLVPRSFCFWPDPRPYPHLVYSTRPSLIVLYTAYTTSHEGIVAEPCAYLLTGRGLTRRYYVPFHITLYLLLYSSGQEVHTYTTCG